MSRLDFSKIHESPVTSGQSVFIALISLFFYALFSIGEASCKTYVTKQNYLTKQQKIKDKEAFLKLKQKEKELIRQSQIKLMSDKTILRNIIRQKVNQLYPSMFLLTWLKDNRIQLNLSRKYSSFYDITINEIFKDENSLIRWINNFSMESLNKEKLPF